MGNWFCTQKNRYRHTPPETPPPLDTTSPSRQRRTPPPRPKDCRSAIASARSLGPNTGRGARRGRRRGAPCARARPLRTARRASSRSRDARACRAPSAREGLGTRRAATRRRGGGCVGGAARRRRGGGTPPRTRPRDDRGGRRLLSERDRADVRGCRRGRERRTTDDRRPRGRCRVGERGGGGRGGLGRATGRGGSRLRGRGRADGRRRGPSPRAGREGGEPQRRPAAAEEAAGRTRRSLPPRMWPREGRKGGGHRRGRDHGPVAEVDALTGVAVLYGHGECRRGRTTGGPADGR